MISNIIKVIAIIFPLSFMVLSGCDEDSITTIPDYKLLKEIYVNSSVNKPGIGTKESPFQSLSTALSVAEKGSVIKISEGTYTVPEDKLLLKAGVTLEGDNASSTIINGDLIDENNSSLSLAVKNLSFDNFIFNRPLYSSDNATKFEISNCICKSISVSFKYSEAVSGNNYSFHIKNNSISEAIKFSQGDCRANGLNYITKNQVMGGIYLNNGKKSIVYVDSNFVEGIIKNISKVETQTYLRFNNIQGRIIDSLEYWTDWASNIIYDNEIHYKPTTEEIDFAAIEHYGASAGILDNHIYITDGSAIDAIVEEYIGLERNIIYVNRFNPNIDTSKKLYGINITSTSSWIQNNNIWGGDIGLYINSISSFVDRNKVSSDLGVYINSNGDFINNTIISTKNEAMIVDGASGKYFNNEISGNNCSVRIIAAKNLFSNNVIDFGGGMFGSTGGNVFESETEFNMIVESNYTDVETIYAKFNKWNHQTEQEIDEFDIYDGKDQQGLSIVTFVPFIED
jgi:hypothetical protein